MTKKTKKPFNVKSFAIATLRKASYRTPMRYQALKKAQVGNDTYKCAHCAKFFTRKLIQIDHISPIVPITGWDGFDGYIMRMFCGVEGLQVLCKPCHKVKSQRENKKRKSNV